MQTQSEATFVSVHTETWGTPDKPGRRDTVNLLQDSGEVVAAVAPKETHGVLQQFVQAGFGARVVALLDVSAWARGQRAEFSFRLVDGSVLRPAPKLADAK